jgi:hypothetical protein
MKSDWQLIDLGHRKSRFKTMRKVFLYDLHRQLGG